MPCVHVIGKGSASLRAGRWMAGVPRSSARKETQDRQLWVYGLRVRRRALGMAPGQPANPRAYTMRYTRLVAKTVPVREFRTNLSTFLSDVADRRDHVLVTRNGKPAAALVPIDEYDALEETAEILSDSETLAAIEAGLGELSRDETVTLEDLRAELDARRSAQ